MRTPADPDRAQLVERGFVALDLAVAADQLTAARAATDRLLAGHGASSQYGWISLDAWRREAIFRELLAAPAAVARRLLDLPEVLVFQDLVIDKPATATSPMPYHQDQAYLPLDRDDGLVAWIALDDADVDNGCLHYVPGTHHLGARRPARFSNAPLRDQELPPIEIGERPIVPVPVRAGAALFHQPYVWHGSPTNRTARPRRAWSIYFVNPDIRWAPERAMHPYLLELAPQPGALVAGDRFPRF